MLPEDLSIETYQNFELMRDPATGELFDCGFMRDLPHIVGRENTDPEVREHYCSKMKREGCRELWKCE